MKSALFVFLLSSLVFAGQKITEEKAQVIACQEAERVKFHFDTSCEDYFYKAASQNNHEYFFFGLNNNCAIEVYVNKVTAQATSYVSCN